MIESSKRLIGRRKALRGLLGAASGLAGGLLWVGGRRAGAQSEPLSASGGGVNVKNMPGVDGGPPVPMRESFSFDGHYAQCIVEDNSAAFVMDTFSMGAVTILPHTFFMAMYANSLSLLSITKRDDKLVATLVGSLDCATEAGTGTTTVGSRTATEPANFQIEAVDAGDDPGTIGDSFDFTVFFDPRQAPINHAIFGPKFTFTGDLVAGKITIAPPVVRSLPA
ncbi:MAG: hypothetical protein HW416_956 [Chloroflexi bacterium]|nr:hypothetical protein [Chloroflexota bacterium]